MIKIPEGKKTSIIYNYIKDQKYVDVIKILNQELEFCPKNRVMSLLGYCYYMIQDYENSSRIYEELTYIYPEIDEYKLYCAQSYYKCGDYGTALNIAANINDEKFKSQLILLNAYIEFEMEQLQKSKSLMQTQGTDDINFLVLDGAISFKEEKYTESLEKFENAKSMFENNSELAYNVALCHYKLKNYDRCMHYIGEIIERGSKDYPELCLIKENDNQLQSVGNSPMLKESALIESFNLRAAIEYNLKNFYNAQEALNDMPYRKEEELDPVSLMNQALINFDNDPSNGLRKLNFLIHNPPFPSETFANLLLLYAKNEYFDLAADILADHSDYTIKYINQEEYEYIDALIFQNSNQDEAIVKFEELGNRCIDTLKRVTKNIKEAQSDKNNDLLQKSLKDFDENLEKYIPILMAQAKIYWMREEYNEIERIFKISFDYCSINDIWGLNYGHVLFIQEKYPEAISYYEKIYEKNTENIYELQAIVIANLCVSYIMINENDKAELIIKHLEESEQNENKSIEKNYFHLCIVNLVIGTLYCSKNNFEFGVNRIIKCFEPIQKKLSTDTWFYAKRCFLALIEKMSKNIIMLAEKVIVDILTFLNYCEDLGKDIKVKLDPTFIDDDRNSVAYESRILKRIFIKLRE